MKYNCFFILVIILTFYSSCFDKSYKLSKPVEIETTPVVQCLFTNGQPFKILVSKTLNLLDPNDVDTLEVDSITISGSDSKTYKVTKKSKYLYESNNCPEIGNYYSICVYTKKYELITAQSYIPAENPEIDSLYYVSSKKNYNLIFEEIKNIPNYYEIITIPIVNTPQDSALVFGDNSNHSFYRNISSDAPIYKKENFKDYLQKQFLLFSDKGYENQTIEFPFIIFHQHPFYVIIKNVSKEYYLFKKTVSRDIYSNGLLDMELDGFIYMTIFQQNTKIYTNINNAIGIFAGFNSKSYIKVN